MLYEYMTRMSHVGRSGTLSEPPNAPDNSKNKKNPMCGCAARLRLTRPPASGGAGGETGAAWLGLKRRYWVTFKAPITDHIGRRSSHREGGSEGPRSRGRVENSTLRTGGIQPLRSVVVDLHPAQKTEPVEMYSGDDGPDL